MAGGARNDVNNRHSNNNNNNNNVSNGDHRAVATEDIDNDSDNVDTRDISIEMQNV